MIYVTSDTHFCHNKPFIYEDRGFKNIEEMNNTIIENWNKLVKPDDTVIHLGDVMLNDNEQGIKCLESLNGKITIIIGNHDTNQRINLYKAAKNVTNVEFGSRLNYKGYSFFCSHYPSICSNFDMGRPLKEQVINLCGHSHATNHFIDMSEDKGYIYHCELDAQNMHPISIDNIIYNVNNYYNLRVHGKKYNSYVLL